MTVMGGICVQRLKTRARKQCISAGKRLLVSSETHHRDALSSQACATDSWLDGLRRLPWRSAAARKQQRIGLASSPP
jgi:hypothetical protein